MVARDERTGPGEDREVPEEGCPVVADLEIVGIGVEADAAALAHQKGALVGNELAAVDHHALVALAMAGDPAILRPGEETVAEMVGRALWR